MTDRMNRVLARMGKLDRPYTDGINRFHAPADLGGCGGDFSREALERVHAVMMDDLAGRSDGSGRFRPSLIGDACLRKILLSYHGAPQLSPSADDVDLMNAGTWRHYYNQAAGLTEGFLAEIEEPLFLDGIRYGQADGRLSDGTLFEFKSTRSRVYSIIVLDKGRPKRDHQFQLHASMRAMGVRLASLVYEDRDNLRRHEFRQSWDDAVGQELDQRLEILTGHVENKTLPKMLDDCARGVGTTYQQCQWREVCPLWSYRRNDE